MARTLLFTLPVGYYYGIGQARVGRDNTDGLNEPATVYDVHVYLDPNLTERGANERVYDGTAIVLREWNLRVLIHELAHVALDHLVVDRDGTVEELRRDQNHGLVNAVEVAFAPLIHQLAAEDAHRGESVIDRG